MAQINLNLSDTQPGGTFEPVPAGDYAVIIIESTVLPTKTGSGQYLELVHEIVNGPFAGRRLWNRLNLWNASEKAQAIARSTLRSITDAVGVSPNLADSEALHNKVLVAKVIIDTDPNYPAKNEIRGYGKATGQQPTLAPAKPAPAAAPAPAPAAAAPAPAPKAAPWKKRA